MSWRIFIVALAVSIHWHAAHSLTCNDDQLKITIKTDPDEYVFDDYEQYMLQATVAYSMRKFCGPLVDAGAGAEWSCPLILTDTSHVQVTEVTERISMCVEVTDTVPDTVSKAIKESKANMNGALLLTDEDLFVEGFAPTLKSEWDPDFDPWLIAYIVICALVVMAGIAMIVYTRMHRSSGKEDLEKEGMLEEEPVYVEPDTQRVNEAFENSSARPTLTML